MNAPGAPFGRKSNALCPPTSNTPMACTEERPRIAHKLPMNPEVTGKGVVIVIDDDVSVRTALKELFESVGQKSNPTHRGGLSWKMAFLTKLAAWCSM